MPPASTAGSHAQEHGYVWKAEIFGNMLYGVGGAEGLRMFYNEEYVKRYPGMSQNLEDAAWKHGVSRLLQPPSATALVHACGSSMALCPPAAAGKRAPAAYGISKGMHALGGQRRRLCQPL